ncbi:MAG: FAD-dependent monooxygenase [Candidatus Kaiserbacteria bacterium]|nr:FAD-dependent monooxygenase [Candidatus Kaiserbacteria bacterium]
MKVLIVGGGIAGCTCAAFLQMNGVAEITLIEKAPRFSTIGYLIGFWGAGRNIMKKLGVEHVLDEKGFEYSEDIVRDQHGRLMKIIKPDALKHHGPAVVIKREDLHRALYELLGGVDVRFGTRVMNIMRQADSVIVVMSDGREERYDLVIGADGIRSSIRELVFGPGFVKSYGWGAWMWWMPQNYRAPKNPTGYYGLGKICGIAPFYGVSASLAVATVPPETGRDPASRREKLLDLFAEFTPEARAIIESAPAGSELYYDDISEVEMHEWYRGRVVLIGDAQHAVSPVTGMGASIAMEDAFVLAEELGRTQSIEDALARFAARREPRVRHFRRLVDHADGWVMTGGVLGYLRNALLPYVPEWYFTNMVDRFLRQKI